MKNIKVVNHGNVFRTGNWYTFYCEKCGEQVIKNTDECEKCKTKLVWKDK